MATKEQQILVTCEYCGGIVNILNHEFCPGCGARFSMDQIEESRKISNENSFNDRLGKKYENSESDDSSEEQDKKIFKGVISFIVAILILIPIYFFTNYYDGGSAVKPDSVVNMYVECAGDVPDGYAQVDCNLKGDKFLYRDDVIKVEITGIYYDTADESNKIIEYCIENRFAADITAYFNLKSVNGKTNDSIKSMRLGGTGVSGQGMPDYSEPIRLEDEELTELVFGNVIVNGPKGKTYNSATDDNDREFHVTVSYPSAETTSAAAED